MDRVLDRFGPTPEAPPAAPPAPAESSSCPDAEEVLSPDAVSEWAASVIEQEVDAAETPPIDHA